MAKSDSKAKKAVLKLLRNTFADLAKCEEIDVKEAYRLPKNKVKVPLVQHPIQVNLFPDGKTLHLYPEKDLQEKARSPDSVSYCLFDPDSYYADIAGFYRLNDGDKITLGGSDLEQRAFLHISKDSPNRKLSISNDEGKLIFKSHVENPKSCISPLLKDKEVHRITRWRKEKLERIKHLLGGRVERLPGKEALKLLQSVNRILKDEAFRPKDNTGEPGGMVKLPDDARAFIIGDLHTKTDNLLTILTQNGFLEALENKQAYLIILGDAVHSEEPGSYAEMESSLLITDVILQLKAAFPEQLFYIRGNHDSFSESIAKKGVPQGALWEKAVIKARGKAYKAELEKFYDRLPFIIYSRHFIACHASPPVSTVNTDTLINIRKYPKIMGTLVNNRLMTPGKAAGYTKGDIKRFRKALKVPDTTPFIVGHTPLTNDETIWERVGEIDNHYIVYGSDRYWIGVMTQIGDKFYPLRYPVEPISSLINEDSTGD